MQLAYIKHLTELVANEKATDVVVAISPYYSQFERDGFRPHRSQSSYLDMVQTAVKADNGPDSLAPRLRTPIRPLCQALASMVRGNSRPKPIKVSDIRILYYFDRSVHVTHHIRKKLFFLIEFKSRIYASSMNSNGGLHVMCKVSSHIDQSPSAQDMS